MNQVTVNETLVALGMAMRGLGFMLGLFLQDKQKPVHQKQLSKEKRVKATIH